MFLSWLPIIGPIIEGLVSAFNKSKDTTVALAKIEGDKEATIIQSTERTAESVHDQVDVRLARDIILFPTCVYTGLIVWDKIVDIKYPNLVWGVHPLDAGTTLQFLPYAVITYLLGYAAIAAWRSK